MLIKKRKSTHNVLPLVGLEPTVFWLEARRLVHLAIRAKVNRNWILSSHRISVCILKKS